MQHPAAEYQEAICAIGIFHPQSQVLFRLFDQPVAQVTGGHEFSILSRRSIVDADTACSA